MIGIWVFSDLQDKLTVLITSYGVEPVIHELKKCHLLDNEGVAELQKTPVTQVIAKLIDVTQPYLINFDQFSSGLEKFSSALKVFITLSCPEGKSHNFKVGI